MPDGKDLKIAEISIHDLPDAAIGIECLAMSKNQAYFFGMIICLSSRSCCKQTLKKIITYYPLVTMKF